MMLNFCPQTPFNELYNRLTSNNNTNDVDKKSVGAPLIGQWVWIKKKKEGRHPKFIKAQVGVES